MSFNFGDYL